MWGIAVAEARTLIVAFDSELDGEFQRAFSEGLDTLMIGFADASVIDADPENPPAIDLYVVSAARRGTGAHDPANTLVVTGGPGGRESGGRALRLETNDLRAASRHWATVAGRIGERMGRQGLADYVLAATPDERRAWALHHPRDPLAADLAESQKPDVLARQLALETRRADEAVAALIQLQRDADAGAIDNRRAQSSAASSHARIVALEAENARLRDQLESAAFALSLVPAGQRECVERARDAAARARRSAANAGEAADTHAGALVWPKGDAAFSGETRNRHPHGPGAMIFAGSGAFYRGDFVDGRREGYGVGRDTVGAVWSGAWNNDGACGFGVLETPDGRRFEGEVEPSEAGPRRVAGHVWPAPTAHAKSQRAPIPLRPESNVRALPPK